ncbi:hypothetical protein [Adoxophyes orana nucleopolyhedrovirus]|uniref:hypothetical protein n=1 Tax=Adoxophyes orana nucleopolyhedrovirus TaxID=542343 RepID=UPI0001829C1D|nr:hypothetical protein [Adoxophyes orana nucleopolyhedrovirus]ACF05370.1 hypothetical protein [Adoxophyes orana nucleopolyhedrovirus]
MIIVSLVLMLLLFVCFIFIISILINNKRNIHDTIYRQYNYIPETLLSTVKVINFK